MARLEDLFKDDFFADDEDDEEEDEEFEDDEEDDDEEDDRKDEKNKILEMLKEKKNSITKSKKFKPSNPFKSLAQKPTGPDGQKKKLNVSRVIALVAALISVISLCISLINTYQIYRLKNKEAYQVHTISKGDYVYFDGENIVMCVDLKITNKGYNDLVIKKVDYQDTVFYSSKVIDKTVYSYDTSVVQFNVIKKLEGEKLDYFRNHVGAGQSMALDQAYAFMATGDIANANLNKDTYENQLKISFTTEKGSKYSTF